MSSRLAFLVILLTLTVCSTAEHTLYLRHKPPVFIASDDAHNTEPTFASLRSIPLNGGLLVSGAYFTELTVGTGPGQRKFNTIIDTGSSNIGIPSVGCSTCNVKPEQLYNATASPTAKPLSCNDGFCRNCVPTTVGSSALPANWANEESCVFGLPSGCFSADNQCTFGITYGGGGGGAAVGTIVEDQVCFSDTNICARSFVEQHLNQYPTGTLSMGIVGFAFPANACNPTCQPTFLDSLVSEGQLDSDANLLGLCLTPRSGGVLDLGHVNASRFTGAIMYTPVVVQRWYNIEIIDILLGGQSINVPNVYYRVTNDIIGSFPDSGTSVVLVGPYTFSAIQNIMLSTYKNLPHVEELFGRGTCVPIANASFINDYPSFDFVISGIEGLNDDFTISISGQNYILPVGDNIYCLGIAGVASIGVVLGDVILQNYYTVFDRVNSRVGFAPVANCN